MLRFYLKEILLKITQHIVELRAQHIAGIC